MDERPQRERRRTERSALRFVQRRMLRQGNLYCWRRCPAISLTPMTGTSPAASHARPITHASHPPRASLREGERGKEGERVDDGRWVPLRSVNRDSLHMMSAHCATGRVTLCAPECVPHSPPLLRPPRAYRSPSTLLAQRPNRRDTFEPPECVTENCSVLCFSYFFVFPAIMALCIPHASALLYASVARMAYGVVVSYATCLTEMFKARLAKVRVRRDTERRARAGRAGTERSLPRPRAATRACAARANLGRAPQREPQQS